MANFLQPKNAGREVIASLTRYFGVSVPKSLTNNKELAPYFALINATYPDKQKLFLEIQTV